jgi:hypothetical protein
MRVRHSKTFDGITLEVEFDQDNRLVADDPAVVSWFDRDDLGRPVLDDTPVGVLDMNLA